MINQPQWKNEWDNELRLLPQVESITNFDLQVTENVFLLWQFLKLYHSSSPQTRSIVDFLASKTPESLQWGKHIDDVMVRGAAKAQQLFNVLIAQGKKIQMKYSKKRLSENLSYYPIKNFIILEKINTGSVGQVHLALDGKTGLFVAAKAIDKSTTQGDLGLFKKLKEEIILSTKMNHPNVVKTMSVLESKDKVIQIMEYCDGGDLISYVRNKLYLDESSAQYFFKKIVEGLKYMHQNNIAHRDLKPENIFLCKKQLTQKEKTLIRIGKLPPCSEYDLKIGDFGASCIDEKNKLHFDIVGTLSYAAPEVLGCTNLTGYDGKKADIWSLGIILYAMFFGLLPFDNEEKDIKEAYNQIIKRKIVLPKNRANKFSENAKNILFGMLNVNPKKRLSLQEIISHKWLEDCAKNKLEISHLNKKTNVPFSSTVAYPIYPIKQLLHNDMLPAFARNKVNNVGQMGNIAKYSNVTRLEKGSNAESTENFDKGGRLYAFPNIIDEKCPIYEIPSHEQMHLNNLNFSNFQNYKHFSNDDLTLYHKTGAFYKNNNINANTNLNQNIYNFEKPSNKNDSYNDLLMNYTGNGNTDINLYTKSGNTNISANTNANANVIYKNNFNKLETHVDSQVLDEVAITYRKEDLNSARDKNIYEKVQYVDDTGFTENSTDRSSYDLLNKYVNSPFYKNNENIIVDFELSDKKYCADKTHHLFNTENMLVKSNTEDNFYFSKKEIKETLLQNYQYVPKPKDMIDMTRVSNVKPNKILNMNNIESTVIIPNIQKTNDKLTEYVNNNQFNRNINYNVNQILYKPNEAIPNAQPGCNNAPYKYYYYNKSNGMYYDSVENVNNFSDNATVGIIPEKQFIFPDGNNNCYMTDAINNNIDKRYSPVSNGDIINGLSTFLKNGDIKNFNDVKNCIQPNNLPLNYIANCSKNFMTNDTDHYTRGVSDVASLNFQFEPFSNGKRNDEAKIGEKDFSNTYLNNEYVTNHTSLLYTNNEFATRKTVAKEKIVAKKENAIKKENVAKKENIIADGHGEMIENFCFITNELPDDNIKKEKITYAKKTGKKDNNEKEKEKEKKELEFCENNIIENVYYKKTINAESNIAELKIPITKMKNESEYKTDIPNVKKKEKKNKEGKPSHGKTVVFSNENKNDVINTNEKGNGNELINGGDNIGSKNMGTLGNKTKENVVTVEMKEEIQRNPIYYTYEFLTKEQIENVSNMYASQEDVVHCENYYLSEEGDKTDEIKKHIEHVGTLQEQIGCSKEKKHLEKKKKEMM